MSTLRTGFGVHRTAYSAAWRIRFALLLCAVVMAQALGLVHGVVHGWHAHPLHAAHAVGVAGVAQHSSVESPQAPDGIEALFASHEETQDCRLLDGLGHHAPVVATPVSAAQPVPNGCARWHVASAFVARTAAHFDARAPPAAD